MNFVMTNVAAAGISNRRWMIDILRSFAAAGVDPSVSSSRRSELITYRDILASVLDPRGLLLGDFYLKILVPAMQKVVGGADSRVFIVSGDAPLQTFCNLPYLQWQLSSSTLPAAAEATLGLPISELYKSGLQYADGLLEEVVQATASQTMTMLANDGRPVRKYLVSSFLKGDLVLYPISDGETHWVLVAIRLVTSRNDTQVAGVPGPSPDLWTQGVPRIEVHLLNSLYSPSSPSASFNRFHRFCALNFVYALVRACLQLRHSRLQEPGGDAAMETEYPASRLLTLEVCTSLYDSHQVQACQSGLPEGSGSICGVYVAAWMEAMVRQMKMDVDGGPVDSIAPGALTSVVRNVLQAEQYKPYGTNALRFYYALMCANVMSDGGAFPALAAAATSRARPSHFDLSNIRHYAQAAYPDLDTCEIMLTTCTSPPTSRQGRSCPVYFRGMHVDESIVRSSIAVCDEIVRLSPDADPLGPMKAMQWYTQSVFSNSVLLNNHAALRYLSTAHPDVITPFSPIYEAISRALVMTNTYTFKCIKQSDATQSTIGPDEAEVAGAEAAAAAEAKSGGASASGRPQRGLRSSRQSQQQQHPVAQQSPVGKITLEAEAEGILALGSGVAYLSRIEEEMGQDQVTVREVLKGLNIAVLQDEDELFYITIDDYETLNRALSDV